jgi:hypothetical protein
VGESSITNSNRSGNGKVRNTSATNWGAFQLLRC